MDERELRELGSWLNEAKEAIHALQEKQLKPISQILREKRHDPCLVQLLGGIYDTANDLELACKASLNGIELTIQAITNHLSSSVTTAAA